MRQANAQENGPAAGSRGVASGGWRVWRTNLHLRTCMLLVTLMAVLPVIVFSAALMAVYLHHQRSASERALEVMTREVSEDVDAHLRRTISSLQALGQADALKSHDLRAFHALARRLIKVQGWDNLQLLGPAGEHLVNARLPFGAPLPAVYRAELATRAASSGKPLVSDIHRGVVSGRLVTAVYVPAAPHGGAVPYVLVASMTPSQWRQLIDDPTAASGGMHAVLLDGRSRMIATTYPDGATAEGDEDARVPFDVAGFAGQADTPQIGTLFGERSYVVWRKSGISGWTLLSFVPAAAFDAPVRRLAVQLAAGFVLFLCAGLSLALWLARRMTRSISKLVASVQSVAAGGAPLPPTTRILEVRQAKRALTDTAALLTARLNSEQAAHAQLERANRAKGEFLAMLGHELRNPLGAIRNAFVLTQTSAPGSDTAGWASSVVDRQTAHMTRLVEDLLDVSRIDTGKIELRKQRTDLRDVLRQTVTDHRGVLHKPGLTLLLDLPPTPVWADCDPVRIAQVTGNLLHNAAKFTNPGGQISVRVSQKGGMASLEVSDTGIGIEPQNLERVFDLFAQERRSGAAASAGLGLGLALARQLVELHGGTISASSEGRDQGCTFRVALPATMVGTP